ncbi:MAG: hypothetical protein HY726_21970 [Candidatus Rokubacteria bacterium]|nr:hypothetical protein [Candidatus Rokubacteria bacterium]
MTPHASRTIGLWTLLALLGAGVWVLLVLLPGRTTPQSFTITLNPVMSRGPLAAPVTIVEFSDYQ